MALRMPVWLRMRRAVVTKALRLLRRARVIQRSRWLAACWVGIDPDAVELGEPVGVEMLVDQAVDQRVHRLPGGAKQRGHRRLRHAFGQPRANWRGRTTTTGRRCRFPRTPTGIRPSRSAPGRTRRAA